MCAHALSSVPVASQDANSGTRATPAQGTQVDGNPPSEDRTECGIDLVVRADLHRAASVGSVWIGRSEWFGRFRPLGVSPVARKFAEHALLVFATQATAEGVNLDIFQYRCSIQMHTVFAGTKDLRKFHKKTLDAFHLSNLTTLDP